MEQNTVAVNRSHEFDLWAIRREVQNYLSETPRRLRNSGNAEAVAELRQTGRLLVWIGATLDRYKDANPIAPKDSKPGVADLGRAIVAALDNTPERTQTNSQRVAELELHIADLRAALGLRKGGAL